MELIEYCTKSKKEHGFKCIIVYPCDHGTDLKLALCCTESREGIYDVLAGEEKIQIQHLMYGFYYVHITFASLCS